MEINLKINGEIRQLSIDYDEMLKDSLRRLGYDSVKSGCNTSSCGLCTVWLDEKPVLSCSVLTIRCEDKEITTLEGVLEEAEHFGDFLTEEGGEQCGFCSPGLIMSVLALKKEGLTEEKEIKDHLQGNLCRCTGYFSQMRAIKKYIEEDGHEKTR
ncbi:MAG: 2Fe-2S iron-sulfur cluster-binding protein [Tissierellia bacterium]|nr:2Fe-2S iron-sulfur cluster-binding protein [Tissierellia bacterium]